MILQQPPSIMMALIFTRPSAILFLAEETILENVGRDILSLFAASNCFNPSRSASLTASNSSRVRYTPFSLFKGLQIGLKHLSPGRHRIHLVFLGRMLSTYCYERMFITILSQRYLLSIILVKYLGNYAAWALLTRYFVEKLFG